MGLLRIHISEAHALLNSNSLCGHYSSSLISILLGPQRQALAFDCRRISYYIL